MRTTTTFSIAFCSLLALAACGRETEPPAAAPIVRTVRTDQRLVVRFGEEAPRHVEPPVLDVEIELRLRSMDEATERWEVRVRGARVGPEGDPDRVRLFQDELAQGGASVLRGTLRTSAAGAVAAEVPSPRAAGPAVRKVAQDVELALALFARPRHAQAPSNGSSVRTVRLGGIEATVRLIRDEKKSDKRRRLVLSAPPQPIDLPGLPAGASAFVDEFSGSGTVEEEGDEETVLPRRGRLDLTVRFAGRIRDAAGEHPLWAEISIAVRLSSPGDDGAGSSPK